MSETLHAVGTPVRDPDGRWHITRHADVVAALADPRLLVPEPVPTTGGPLDRLRTAVSRFSNGPQHAERRAAAINALSPLDPATLRRAAAQRMTSALASGGRIDLAPRLRTIPVVVLAEALGIKRELTPLATRAVSQIAAAYPPGATPEAIATADQAVIRLAATLAEPTTAPSPTARVAGTEGSASTPTASDEAGPASDAPRPGPAPGSVRSGDGALFPGDVSHPRGADSAKTDMSREVVARVTVLVQACDATAGLIGNALVRMLDGWRDAPVEAVVRETLRHDAPVRATVRVAASDSAVGGQAIRAGEVLVLDLAAANRDPDVFPEPGRFAPYRKETGVLTFGAGLRPCPADDLALAIAAGAVEAARHCELAAVDYGAPGNLRVPELLEVIA